MLVWYELFKMSDHVEVLQGHWQWQSVPNGVKPCLVWATAQWVATLSLVCGRLHNGCYSIWCLYTCSWLCVDTSSNGPLCDIVQVDSQCVLCVCPCIKWLCACCPCHDRLQSVLKQSEVLCFLCYSSCLSLLASVAVAERSASLRHLCLATGTADDTFTLSSSIVREG